MFSQRMKKIYYNAEMINTTQAPIDCQYLAGLLAPIVSEPEKFNINVNRFRLPISGIPLSLNNIPFNQWQVSLGHNNNGNWIYQNAMVPQFKPKVASIYTYLISVEGNNGVVRKYLDGTFTDTGISASFPLNNAIWTLMCYSMTPHFIFVCGLGSNEVYIYNHENLTLKSSVQITGTIQAICCNSADAMLFIAFETNSSIVIQSFTYSSLSNIWSLTSTYSNLTNPILEVFGIAFVEANGNKFLYATALTVNKNYFTYQWGNSGEPLNRFQSPNDYKSLSIYTYLNGVIVYQEQLPIKDQILANVAQPGFPQAGYYYDITNNFSKWSSGGGIFAGQIAVMSTDTIQYLLSSDGSALYVGPYGSNTSFVEADSTPGNLTTIANNNGTLYGVYSNILVGYDASFWFNVGNSNISINSMDFNSQRQMLVASNGNILLSNQPLTRYYGLCNQGNNTFQIVASDPATQFVETFKSNISISSSTQNGYIYKHPHHYCINATNNSVSVFDTAFSNVIATFAFAECLNGIVGLKTDNNHTHIIAVDGSNTVRIYNFTGVFLGFVGSTTNIYTPIGQNHLATLSNNGLISIYNITNPSTPVLLQNITFGSTPVIEMTYDPTMSLLVVLTQNQMIAYSFGSQDYSSPPSKYDNNITQTYTNIRYEPIYQYITATFNNNGVLQMDIYQSDTMTTGLIQLQYYVKLSPIGSHTIVYDFSYLHAGFLQYTQISSNIPVLSVCYSKLHEDTIYALGQSDGLCYVGKISNNQVNLVLTGLTTNPMIQLTCVGVSIPNPINSVAIYSSSYDQQLTFTAPDRINFITSDINNYIVLGYNDRIDALNPNGNGNGNGDDYQDSIAYSIEKPFQGGFSPSPLENVDAGPYTITTFQQYLSQINLAFQNAYNAMQASVQSYAITSPPRMLFNPESKLFEIVCDGGFLNSSTDRILINSNLQSLFGFSSIQDANTPQGFYSILVLNNVNNISQNSNGAISSVLITQECSSMYKLYDLVRIIVGTSRIPVLGDVEGINSSVNLITDIVPDTSTLTPPNDIIIYQPTILRNYNLNTNVMIKDIDIQFFYGTKSGEIYPVKLMPGEYASIKLEFEQVIE
jgi:hypothetical protein